MAVKKKVYYEVTLKDPMSGESSKTLTFPAPEPGEIRFWDFDISDYWEALTIKVEIKDA